jgi:hypothetical protein
MTELPETLIEAEALAYARAEIARLRGAEGDSDLLACDGSTVYVPLMKHVVMFSAWGAAEIAYFARQGFEDADLARISHTTFAQ